jgi:hypothetical protein
MTGWKRKLMRRRPTDFTYTISCIDLQSFLSSEAKTLGFRSLKLHHPDDDHPRPCPGHGLVIWDHPLEDQQIMEWKRLTGIEFLIHHPHMRTIGFFSFIVIEGAYYCYREGAYAHDDNPFKIRTFELHGAPSQENDVSTIVMLRDPYFLHLQRDTLGADGQKEDHLCFSKTTHRCDVCRTIQEVLVLHFSDAQCLLCFSCFNKLHQNLKTS